jgi:hypothetical protein
MLQNLHHLPMLDTVGLDGNRIEKSVIGPIVKLVLGIAGFAGFVATILTIFDHSELLSSLLKNRVFQAFGS